MRITALETGHSRVQKAQLQLARAITGAVPPPILVMSYRRNHFGRLMAPCFQEAMRKGTEWSKPVGSDRRAPAGRARVSGKLVLAPDAMTPDDARRALATGVSKRALREAAYVAFVFGVMDRLADAFGFEPETGSELVWTARILLRLGYGIASVPG